MITVAPFLRRHRPARVEPENRAVSILLEGIAHSALPAQMKEMAEFEESVMDLAAEVTPATSPERIALIAGAVVRGLKAHNAAARSSLQAHERELREMRGVVELLAGSLARLGFESSEPARIVQQILEPPAVEEDSGAESLADLRARLAESLNRSVGVVQHLQEQSQDAEPGLPGQSAAMAELSAIWGDREDVCTVVFGIERMASINAHFGFKAGDQMISSLREHLAMHLAPGDQLYRWRGPYLLALLKRDLSLGLPRAEAARIAAWCTEYGVTARNREALVPVSVMWELFALREFAGIEDMVACIDEFLARHLHASTHVQSEVRRIDLYN